MEQHPPHDEENGSIEQQETIVHHAGGFEITIRPSTPKPENTTPSIPTTPKANSKTPSIPTTPKHENGTNSPLQSIITVPSNNNNNNSTNKNPTTNDQIQAPTSSTHIDSTLGKGIQRSFTTASNLANFLPTGTSLVFTVILPTIYRTGQCSSVSTVMMIVLLCLCVSLCFLSSFTDSYELLDKKGKKKIFYGFVTPKGLWVHNYPQDFIGDRRYKLGFADVLHAGMSAMVFLAVAFSDNRVIDCLFPGHEKDVEDLMQSLVLVIGVVCSSVFLLFPVHRRGFVPSLPNNKTT